MILTLYNFILCNYSLIILCLIPEVSIIFSILVIYINNNYNIIIRVNGRFNSYLVFILGYRDLVSISICSFILWMSKVLSLPLYRFIFILLYVIICKAILDPNIVFMSESDPYTPYPFDTWSSVYDIDNPRYSDDDSRLTISEQYEILKAYQDQQNRYAQLLNLELPPSTSPVIEPVVTESSNRASTTPAIVTESSNVEVTKATVVSESINTVSTNANSFKPSEHTNTQPIAQVSASLEGVNTAAIVPETQSSFIKLDIIINTQDMEKEFGANFMQILASLNELEIKYDGKDISSLEFQRDINKILPPMDVSKNNYDDFITEAHGTNFTFMETMDSIGLTTHNPIIQRFVAQYNMNCYIYTQKKHGKEILRSTMKRIYYTILDRYKIDQENNN